MKKFLFSSNYGWTESQFKNNPHFSMVEIIAENEEEAIEKITEQHNKPQFPDKENPNGYPFWWKVTGILEWEEGKFFRQDHKKILLTGKTGE